MERLAYKQLLDWKNNPRRKPLILKGARQVGKTYLLRQFGKNEYKNVAYINCETEHQAELLFTDYDVDRIVRVLSAITKVSVQPKNTLIIFDEIQEQPKGLTALKYFCENAPEYHVAVAGSLLGITLHNNTSFPVGKVNTIELSPMNFIEFLDAMGESAKLEVLMNDDWSVINSLCPYYVELLRQYYYVGGMPEAVSEYVRTKNLKAVRDIQQEILSNYSEDFSKHAPTNEIARLNLVWRSIPSQMARENKKFLYGAVKKGARANDFETSIQWLMDSGLVYKVNRIQQATMPLKFYEDFDAFKLFMLDCGLFGAFTNTSAADILAGNNVFVEYKGAFTELFVLQQLASSIKDSIYYYTNSRSTLEVDFVIQTEKEVIPIEVKAEVNTKSKSFRTFLNDNPKLTGARFSMLPYIEQDQMVNYPLFAISRFLNDKL